MDKNRFEIDSTESLAALRNLVRRDRPRRFTQVAVRIPGASEVVNAGWRRRIEHDHLDCGCAYATAASLIAVAGYALWWFFRPAGWAALGWTDAAMLAAVFVLATGLGKWVGKQLARMRLAATLEELAREFPPPRVEPAPRRAACGVH
jgi:VIT1/CCC1 family predicted Fe2+/Mn2+ transporter